MRNKAGGYMTAQSGSFSGTAQKARCQPLRASMSASSVVLLKIESDEPSDAMMAHIASLVDQSLVADDSI